MRKCPKAAGYSSPCPALPQGRQVDDSSGERKSFLKYSFPAGLALPLPPVLRSRIQIILSFNTLPTLPRNTRAHAHTLFIFLSLPLVPLWMIQLLPETSPHSHRTKLLFYPFRCILCYRANYFPKLESSQLFWWIQELHYWQAESLFGKERECQGLPNAVTVGHGMATKSLQLGFLSRTGPHRSNTLLVEGELYLQIQIQFAVRI